jgi:hypothetical protein
MSVKTFGDHSLRNLRGAPELCEPLLRAVSSLLYLVHPDGNTKGFTSEGSINIYILSEDMKNEAEQGKGCGKAA